MNEFLSRDYKGAGWFQRLLSLLKPSRWLIVEIEKPQAAHEADGASIPLLAHHPGFLALSYKLNLQKAALRLQLEQNRHGSIRDVDLLQSGLYWLGYLQREVANSTKVKAKFEPREVEDQVKQEFEKVRLSIESIGTTGED